MDTDELSTQAYNAVMITAEKFNHNLTLQFGLLSYQCENESDYLQKAIELIKEWSEDIEDSIEEIFFDVKHPTEQEFKKVLLEIKNNISKVLEIPLKERTYEF
jgi:hypothetical protein